MKILFGVIGAVLGFVAALAMLELGGFGNKADPIMSGLIALFVFGPIGAVAGAVLGTKLAMSLRRDQDAAAAGGLAKNSLKALGVVVGLVAISGTLYYAYAVWTATPWLNPNACHAGAAVRNPPCSRGGAAGDQGHPVRSGDQSEQHAR